MKRRNNQSGDSKANTLQLGRSDWHLLANSFVVLYLFAALISAIFDHGKGHPVWLTIHLFLLGSLTNAIVTWSDHFSSALLWARSQDRSRQLRIIFGLNSGILGVLIGVTGHHQWLVATAATLIVAVLLYYLRGVASLARKSLNKRFAKVINFYKAAAVVFFIGIVLGVIAAPMSDSNPWQPRITLAHLHANLLGWVGLTITGTLVTLWPTILRTQMDPRSMARAARGLAILLLSLVMVIAGPLLDQYWILAIGLLGYLVGLVIALAPAASLMRTHRPDRFSAWMIFSGTLGFVALLLIDIALNLLHQKPEQVLTVIEGHLLLFFTLWLLPTLLGALTHLLPVVLGRGPASNRKLEGILNRGWKWRLILLPLSSLFQVLPSQFHIVGFFLAAIAVGVFLILVIAAMRGARRVTTSL